MLCFHAHAGLQLYDALVALLDSVVWHYVPIPAGVALAVDGIADGQRAQAEGEEKGLEIHGGDFFFFPVFGLLRVPKKSCGVKDGSGGFQTREELSFYGRVQGGLAQALVP